MRGGGGRQVGMGGGGEGFFFLFIYEGHLISMKFLIIFFYVQPLSLRKTLFDPIIYAATYIGRETERQRRGEREREREKTR